MVLLSGVPLDQIDAATRKRLGLPNPKRAPKTTRKEVAGPGLPVVCYYCKEPCDGKTALDRHSDETGHARFECLTGG